MYHDGWTALRAARAKRAAALGIVPENAPMVTMETTPDWSKLSADERKAAARVMQAYAGMATAMDREIGRLVAHLKATDQYDDTVFVFLSDNGPEPTDPYNRLRNRIFLNIKYYQSFDNIRPRNSLHAIAPRWAHPPAPPPAGFSMHP